MSYLVEIHPDAIQEAAAAVEWYASRSQQTAVAFIAELDRAVEIISKRRNHARDCRQEPVPNQPSAGLHTCTRLDATCFGDFLLRLSIGFVLRLSKSSPLPTGSAALGTGANVEWPKKH